MMRRALPVLVGAATFLLIAASTAQVPTAPTTVTALPARPDVPS